MNQIDFPMRLEIYMANLPKIGGSIQRGTRPVLVIQNNVGNANSPTIIIVPLTSKEKKMMPTHVHLPPKTTGLPRNSIALCEQILTVPKTILYGKVGQLTDESYIGELQIAIARSVGLCV